MAKNPRFHKRCKHIAIRWHWVRDLVQEGYVRIESCRQGADKVLLTKALPRPKARLFTSSKSPLTSVFYDPSDDPSDQVSEPSHIGQYAPRSCTRTAAAATNKPIFSDCMGHHT